MGSHRVGHDRSDLAAAATEQRKVALDNNWTNLNEVGMSVNNNTLIFVNLTMHITSIRYPASLRKSSSSL